MVAVPEEAYRTVQELLNELAYTAATHDLDGHMALISKRVELRGIPGVERIDYNGWYLRRHNEFDQRLLQSIVHRNIRILTSLPDKIIFSVDETLTASNGRAVTLQKEVVIALEQDGQWRIIQEFINNIVRS